MTESGGVPTAAVTDLAATPGLKMKLIDHDELVDGMNKHWGPLYVKAVIPAGSYPGQDKPNAEVDVWNILIASDKMSDQMAYNIVKTLLEHGADPNAGRAAALRIAARTGHREVFELLLEYGGDPKAPLVLWSAAVEDYPEIVELVLQRGPDREDLARTLNKMDSLSTPVLDVLHSWLAEHPK